MVVEGDLFDSPRPTQSTAASARSAIFSSMYAIPGNNDHSGVGRMWTEPFFLRESAILARKLQVLFEDYSLTTDDAVHLGADW
jgi:hypothetical protein